LGYFFELTTVQEVLLLGSSDEDDVKDWISKLNKDIKRLRKKKTVKKEKE